jgi:histidinol-phosphatase (PHP family)
MEEYLKKAIENNMKYICFTDHVDLNKNDYGYGYYNVDKFFEVYNKMQDKYGDKIQLLSGIEFSEPHLYKSELEKLYKHPYDFIIGSIHWVGDMFPCQEIRKKYSVCKFYEMYWQEVLKAVEVGGFDCLGHIDFPKRYYGDVVYDETLMNEIFNRMKKNNIVMEINTSSLRKGLSTSLPDLDLLRLYKNNGGTYVTIGSDAHSVEDLGANNNYAKDLIKQTLLSEVIFRQHKAFSIS